MPDKPLQTRQPSRYLTPRLFSAALTAGPAPNSPLSYINPASDLGLDHAPGTGQPGSIPEAFVNRKSGRQSGEKIKISVEPDFNYSFISAGVSSTAEFQSHQLELLAATQDPIRLPQRIALPRKLLR